MFIKTSLFIRANLKVVLNFMVLLAVANVAPLVGVHSQFVTGPLVNMALILAVYLVGARGAMLIGILPSTIALGTGLLPAVLAPMVPFIILSNVILIITIDFLRQADFRFPLLFKEGIKRWLYRTVFHRPAARLQSTTLQAGEASTFNHYFFALFCAAALKYLLLALTSSVVINLLLNKAVAAKVAAMMSWPQLATALLGGILAYGVLKILRK